MPLQSSALDANGIGRVFRQTFPDLARRAIEPEALALNRKKQTCVRRALSRPVTAKWSKPPLLHDVAVLAANFCSSPSNRVNQLVFIKKVDPDQLLQQIHDGHCC